MPDELPAARGACGPGAPLIAICALLPTILGVIVIATAAQPSTSGGSPTPSAIAGTQAIGAFAICAGITFALYLFLLTVVWDSDGLRWRTLGGVRRIRWADIVDYYYLPSKQETRLVLITSTCRLSVYAWFSGRKAFERVVAEHATEARATSWAALGTRRIDPPRTFTYATGEIRTQIVSLVICSVGLVIYFPILYIAHGHYHSTSPAGGAAITLVKIKIGLMSQPSPSDIVGLTLSAVAIASLTWSYLRCAVIVDDSGMTQLGLFGERYLTWDSVVRWKASRNALILASNRSRIEVPSLIGDYKRLIDAVRHHAPMDTGQSAEEVDRHSRKP